jgi:ABC-type branched-subunit amino acid transport system substrate-binding protein
MKFLSSLFGVFLFFMISSPSVLSQPSLKIGSLIPFADRWEDSGRECAKGMLDASKWINQRGGISGTKLEFLLIEDTFQPAETVAAFRKLNETDQILLLYIYSTETALALLPHIQFNRIPALASLLPFHLAHPDKYPFIFSVNPTALDLYKIAIKFILERSGIKLKKPKFVFVGFQDPLSRDFLNEAKEYARGMGLDIGPDIWISEPSSPSALLLPMQSYNPDFAYLSLSSKETPPVLQAAKQMNFRNQWICNMKAFDESLSPFDGVLGVQPIAPFGEDVPGMAGIKEAHQRWHPYDFHTLSYVEGWATIQVIGEALRRSLLNQGSSRDRVKLALESFKDFVVGGLLPPLTITTKDHRPSVESKIMIIKDGKISRYTEFISVER